MLNSDSTTTKRTPSQVGRAGVGGRLDVVVRKHERAGARQPHAVDEAGVIALVGEDDVAGFGSAVSTAMLAR